MNKCSIVIGSYYGDEGKGHMTDILCAKNSSTLNVRFNGGAQASHTVVTDNGKRHAFRHFGSGTFSHATTYLSGDFIINPVAFVLEADELEKNYDIFPKVFVNPNAIVTTPWDMYINQILERLRGKEKHGSCGFGINETILRSKNEAFKITVKDLNNTSSLISKLEDIKDRYVTAHLKSEYNIDFVSLNDEDKNKFESYEEINMYVFFVKEFLKKVSIKENSILNNFQNVVFEGAQGLLLDKDNKESFPHVTPTKTGTTNTVKIITDSVYDGEVDVYYMSRCYMTRHGAGPLKNELKEAPYNNICDLTNVKNEFQGSLRYSYLDLDILISNILNDMENLIGIPNKKNIYITFTCFDEKDNEIMFYYNGKLNAVSKDDYLVTMWEILSHTIHNLTDVLVTDGPTKDDVFSFKEKYLTCSCY